MAREKKEDKSGKGGGRKRRFGRRFRIAAGMVVSVTLLTLIVLLGLYQTGTFDSYIKNQFVEAFDDMGISFSPEVFTVTASPLTMEIRNAVFTNKKTGEKIAFVREARFGLTVLDMFALKTERNVNIETTDIYGLEVWLNFDENGRSNLDGVKITPPQRSVKFRYASARVSVRESKFHFGQQTRRISGNAEELALIMFPSDKTVEGSEVNYRFDLSSPKAEFTYGDEQVPEISVRAVGNIHEKGVGLDSLSVDTPIGNSTLAGSVTSWSPFRYDLSIVSDVDLTQASRVFPIGTAVSGTGSFRGKVTGEGEKYRIEGEIVSESLAAENIRLKALQVNASADGEGSLYRASGKAIAELLTFGEFRLDHPQLTGSIRGTGTDFKWVGALETAALDSPLGTIGSLYINDAVAEYRDNALLASLNGVSARTFSSPQASLESIQTPSIRIVSRGDVTTASVATARAGRLDVEGATLRGVDINGLDVETRRSNTDIEARTVQVEGIGTRDARLSGVTANDVRVTNRDGTTSATAGRIVAERTTTSAATIGKAEAKDVTVDIKGDTTNVNMPAMRIAFVETDAAILSELNIAGVRLTVRQGTIAGNTDDFKPGTVELKGGGRLEDVAVYKPVFVLEPSGRYRASMDLTLGGGLLGSIDLGEARASVVADNDRIVLNDITAVVMEGNLAGNGAVALKDSDRSEITADFTDLDLAKLLALQSGSVLPLEGKTTGTADLTFAGTDVRRATGTLNATVSATAGDDRRGFLPVTGNVSLTAEDGLVTVQDARLSSERSAFAATGQLDLYRSGSDLAIDIDSTDAREIERLVRIFELSPQLRDQLEAFEGGFAGNFTFDGRLRGSVESPSLSGDIVLESLLAASRVLGSLSAHFETDPAGTEISQGLLRESDGGSIEFSAAIPAAGKNNTSIKATLRDFNIGTLLTAVPIRSLPSSLRDLQAKGSGNLDLTGLPNEMRGSAQLSAGAGTLNGETFDDLRMTVGFDGTLVNLEEFEAKFGAGILTMNGFYRTDTGGFVAQAKGRGVPASRILAFVPKNTKVPDAEGRFDVDLTALGTLDDASSYDIEFSGKGESVVINGNSFGEVSFNGKTANQVFTGQFATTVGGRRQVVNATADLTRENVPFRATASLDATPLGPYIGIFRKPAPDKVSLGGSATGDIVMEGDLVTVDDQGKKVFTASLLRGSAKLSQFELLVGETPLEATNEVDLTFDVNRVTIDTAHFSGGGTNLAVSGTKALTDETLNNLSINGRMDLRVLNALSSDFFFSGVADVGMTLTGANKVARLNGVARLERGSLSTFIGPERVTLDSLTGCVIFNTKQVLIGCNDNSSGGDRIAGRLGGGEVLISGEVVLTDDLLIDMFRMDIAGTNVRAPLPTGFNTLGNADLSVTGRRSETGFNSLVSGTIYARRSTYTRDIDLADFISGRTNVSLSKGSDSSSLLRNTRLDIRILGRDALVVRNNLADLTATADLRVTGDAESPAISGRISANRGTIFFRDDRYEIQRGTLTFPPNTTIEPVISLQAEAEIRGYQVFVTLSGDLTDSDSLTATLRSNPALPQADVVSLITTGNLSNTGTGIPTYAQSGLNTAAEILADEIINKPISRATDKLFGLNRFNLDPIVSGDRGNPTARLTIGRQINRNLLVTYSTNLSQDQNQVLALEYRVSNRLSFVAQYEQRALSNVTRNRNVFNFEVRLRKRF